MQINWIHRDTKKAKDLVQYFKETWESVVCDEMEFKGETYIKITAAKDQTTGMTFTVNGYRGIRFPTLRSLPGYHSSSPESPSSDHPSRP